VTTTDLGGGRALVKWITREKVKVDRVACPWLVQRFIDPDAIFEFLPKETDWTSIAEGLYSTCLDANSAITVGTFPSTRS
jgi:hypothetical protein